MKIPTPSKGWVYLGVVAATALTLWGTYYLGSSSGKDHVQQQWDAQKVKDLQAANKLRDEYRLRESKYQQTITTVESELRNAQTQHQSELSRLTAEYTGRLLKSEGRVGVYQRQAQGSAADRERLASHAAQLDRSLEEGRQLVAELRATVGLREEQLKSLAAQIRADRELTQ